MRTVREVWSISRAEREGRWAVQKKGDRKVWVLKFCAFGRGDFAIENKEKRHKTYSSISVVK